MNRSLPFLLSIALLLTACGGARIATDGGPKDRLRLGKTGESFDALAEAGRINLKRMAPGRDGRLFALSQKGKIPEIRVFDAGKKGAPEFARLLLPKAWIAHWSRNGFKIDRYLALHRDKVAFGHYAFRTYDTGKSRKTSTVFTSIEVMDWKGNQLFTYRPANSKKGIVLGTCGMDFNRDGTRLGVCFYRGALDAGGGWDEFRSEQVVRILDGRTGKVLGSAASALRKGSFWRRDLRDQLAFDGTGERLMMRGEYWEKGAYGKIDKGSFFTTFVGADLAERVVSGEEGFYPIIHLSASADGSRRIEGVKGHTSKGKKKPPRVHVNPVTGKKSLAAYNAKNNPIAVAAGPKGQVAWAEKNRFVAMLLPEGKNKSMTIHKVKLSGKPLALLYDPEAREWRAVTEKGVKRFGAWSETQARIMRLCARAKEAMDSGIKGVAMRLLEESIETDTRRFKGRCSPIDFLSMEGADPAALGRLTLKRFDLHRKKLKVIGQWGVTFKGFDSIQTVKSGGAAERAGLKAGDAVRAIIVNGMVREPESFKAYIEGGVPPGAELTLEITRGGDEMTVVVPSETRLKGDYGWLPNWLFEYGMMAAQAGHPGIVRQTAAKLRTFLAETRPSWNWEKAERLPIALDALALAWEGKVDEALDLLASDRSAQRHVAIRNGIFASTSDQAWFPLYQKPKALAYVLGDKTEAQIKKGAPRKKPKPVPFFDLEGNLVQPIAALAPPPLAPTAVPAAPAAPATGVPAPSRPGAMVLD